MTRWSGALRVAALLLVSARAETAAAADPICADRPGKANPTCTVPAGMIQIETGLADWTRDDADGSSAEALVLGATALKYGLTPTAGRAVGNRKLEAGLALPIDYAIANSPFSIALGPEVDWLADDDGAGHHAAMIQVVGVGAQLTPRLNVGADLWGQWNWDPAGTTRQASADGAAAWLVSDNFQIDGGANFGLNRQTPDVELYAGVSTRF